MPYATVPDLEARWRPLTSVEQTRATALLDDASALVDDLAPAGGPSASEATLKAVVCAMVKRAMNRPAELDGVTQSQQTSGPFSQGVTYDNPTGDLYLTKQEKVRLGFKKQRAGSVDMFALRGADS